MQTGTEEELVPRNAIAGISPSPDSAPSLEATVGRWLVKFCATFDKNLTPLLRATWYEALADLDVQMIELACLETSRTAEFFPSPGAVRKRIQDAQSKGRELDAEEQWRKALNVAAEFFQPDVGLYRNAPQLSKATWHALKVAGGLEHLQSCKREELQWARRRFIADYMLIHETRQVEHLLGDGEAKRILAEIADPAKPKPKQLKSPEPEGNLPSRAEVRTVLDRVAEIPSEEEWERRKRDQKERAAAWIAAHPEAVKQGAAQ